MTEIPCISFDAFFAIFERKWRRRYTIFWNFFVSYAVLIYFYIKLVGFCDAINIKGVNFFSLFRKRQSDAQQKNKVLK